MVTPDPWSSLRSWTDARIGLGRAGISLPTAPLLDFQRDHARARDAVVRPCAFSGLEGLRVESLAADRAEYLKRPDRGRRLTRSSEALLEEAGKAGPWNVGLVVADGLSSLAVDTQASPLLAQLMPLLAASGLTTAPLVLALQARVALSDEVGVRLGVEVVVMLIGERPGLTSADSLSVYLTWGPRTGRQNAERNCVSNIRPAGLPYDAAAKTIRDLVVGARHLGASGIRLKEDSWLQAP